MVVGRLILEYSKSARAACPLCGSTIGKGVVRVGREAMILGRAQTRWHHPNCFAEHHPEADFADMSGFVSLKVADQAVLKSVRVSFQKEPSRTTVTASVTPNEALDSSSVKGLSAPKELGSVQHLQLSTSYKDIPLPEGWKAYSTVIMYAADNLKPSEKIAAFDFDGTLVETSLYRTGADAWSLLRASVPAKLASFHQQGYKLVVFTNESNIDRYTKQRAKAINSKLGRLRGFMDVVKVPLQVFIACGTSSSNDSFRKPATGMWQLLENHLNAGIPIDKERSFYVGDAAGRKTDHSDADSMFAKRLGLKFLFPEELFSSDSNTSAGKPVGGSTTVSTEQPETKGTQDTLNEFASVKDQTAEPDLPGMQKFSTVSPRDTLKHLER